MNRRPKIAAPGLVLVALLTGLTGLTACGKDGESVSVTPRAGITQDILGTWYPQDIAGYTLPPGAESTYVKARITFKEDGTWSGSDGCNGLGGTYEISEGGKFSATPPDAMTAIGCANVPNVTVISSSSLAQVENGVLVLGTPKTDGTVAPKGSYMRTVPVPGITGERGPS